MSSGTGRKIFIFVVLAVVVGAAAGLGWWWSASRPRGDDELILYGNIDLRQVELAFNNSERITAVLVQEGDRVRPGEVVARLDTSRLEPLVAQAQAQADAQQQVVERLHNGSRPEEIAQSRANVEAARADAENAAAQYQRLKTLASQTSGARHEPAGLRTMPRRALDVAQARLDVNQKALDLELAGPRKEDIAQAEAQLGANLAQLSFLKQQLADAQLTAPANGVIRSRLMEAGELSTPQKPVFSIAITDPKWVRAYVSEPDLGDVHPGMPAQVAVDSFPNRRFKGWIGFISPIAEFTPKEVQTQELRTSLVYEVRVFVEDASDDLRLGMPATVYLSRPESNANSSSTTAPAGVQ